MGRSAHETKDAYGHVHKSHRFGGYQRELNQRMEESLKPLREAHAIVRDASQHCQALFDLLLISQTYWHRGFTLPRQLDDDSGTETKLVLEPDSTSPERDLAASYQPASARMLEQAFAIHNSLAERDAPSSEFPVLCITDATWASGRPRRAILDSESMTYFDGVSWQPLSLWDDDPYESNREPWHEILDQLERIEGRFGLQDLRWFHRNSIPGYPSQESASRFENN
jgi:hypothetical protein